MKRVVKEAMGDCSTVEEFRFLVRCQECGGIWHSSPIRFSKAGAEPEPEGMRTIFRTLYEREREAARERVFQLLSCLRQTGVRPMLSDLRGSGSVHCLRESIAGARRCCGRGGLRPTESTRRISRKNFKE